MNVTSLENTLQLVKECGEDYIKHGFDMRADELKDDIIRDGIKVAEYINEPESQYPKEILIKYDGHYYLIGVTLEDETIHDGRLKPITYNEEIKDTVIEREMMTQDIKDQLNNILL